MMKQDVIAVIDVGKTNKKLLLFNRQYEMVYEWTEKIPETIDEDGFPCEDVQHLRKIVFSLIDKAVGDDRFVIGGLHFTSYGASFVYLDDKGEILTPLYNYLKPFPATLQDWFYDTYGDPHEMARATASPILGSLNSGLQVLRIKKEKPAVWSNLKYALHLPQYLGYLFHHKGFSDITSIGCHTQLWSFDEQRYHQWVIDEQLDEKFGPIKPCDHIEMISLKGNTIPCGIGLHDSSSALIPYLRSFSDPFVLISTGTWSICMNPFDHTPLTQAELASDCLCYIQYNGQPVKASRLFMGRIHDEALEKLVVHFAASGSTLAQIDYDTTLHTQAKLFISERNIQSTDAIDFTIIPTAALAYVILIELLVKAQLTQLDLVLKHAAVDHIYVDGGFSKNAVFMTILAKSLPDKKLYASEVAQATALGAALALHDHWNPQQKIEQLIQLIPFEVGS